MCTITINIAVKKYGNDDVDGEFFEINQMRDRAVVLDAINIAHNSNGSVDKKVLAQNIVLVVDFFKQICTRTVRIFYSNYYFCH